MTRIAGDRFAGFHPGVFVEREAECVVGEGVFTEVGQGRGLPAMFLVAVAAGKVGGFLKDGTVKPGNIAHLIGNIRMTFQAAIRHCGLFPRRSMTGFAFLDLGMRIHAADGFARLGVQRAGTEHLPPAGKRRAGKTKHCKDCGDKT